MDYFVEDLRPFAGSLTFDEEGQRALVGRVVDSTINIASTLKNHSIIGGGEPMPARLSEARAPTLLLHGTDDPMFPYAHGEALADEIPEAGLRPLARVGHEVPPRPVWDQVVRAILEHTAE